MANNQQIVKAIKAIPTMAGTAYDATKSYRLLDYIVVDGVTVYTCKKVDKTTMTCVGHPLTDTDYWDKSVDLSGALKGTPQIAEMDKAVQRVQQQADASKEQIQALVNALPVVQQTGDSTTSVMSQKAVSEKLSVLSDSQSSLSNRFIEQDELANKSIIQNSIIWNATLSNDAIFAECSSSLVVNIGTLVYYIQATKGDLFSFIFSGVPQNVDVRVYEKKDGSNIKFATIKTGSCYKVANEDIVLHVVLYSRTNNYDDDAYKAQVCIVKGNIFAVNSTNALDALRFNLFSSDLTGERWIVGKYYNRGNGEATDTRRAYLPKKIFVSKGVTYNIKNNSLKLLACFYNLDNFYVKDYTGWFNSDAVKFTPTEDGFFIISAQTSDSSSMTNGQIAESGISVENNIFDILPFGENVKTQLGDIKTQLGDIKTQLGDIESHNLGNKTLIAENLHNISTLSNRLSYLENKENIVSPTGFQEAEQALRIKIAKARDFGDPMFAIVSDTHYAPTMGNTPGKYIGDSNKETMESHAKCIASLADYMGVDWLGHCGDIVSGENYTNKTLLLRDFSNIFSLFKTGKTPFVYSMAHHELYFNKTSEDMSLSGGAARNEVWNLGGYNYPALDRERILGVSYNNETNGQLYYYFDNNVSRIRIINLCTVDGGLCSVGYGQLVWIRDVALKYLPDGFGVILIGHVPLSKDFFGYNSHTYGLSKNNTTYDHGSNGLDLNSILNDAIDNGVNILAYICGHTHFDDVYTLKGSKYPIIMVNCDIPSKVSDSIDTLGDYESYQRTFKTVNEYAVDFFVPKIKEGIVYSYRFGAGHDRVVFTRPKTIKKGETLDLTSIVGVSNDYKSLDNTIATINSGVISALDIGQTQVIFNNKSENKKYFIEILVVND